MSEEKVLSVTFKVTDEDIFQYMQDHGFYFWRVMLPVALLFCVAAFGILGILQNVTALYLTLLGGVMTIAAGVWWYRFYVHRMARRWYRNTPGVTGDYRLEIRPSGLSWSGELSDATIRWAAYTCVRGTADQIYFYQQQRARLYVPRRAFASPEEAEAFLQAAKEWHAAATAVLPVREG